MDKAEARSPQGADCSGRGPPARAGQILDAGEREAVGGYAQEFDATQTEPPLDKMFLKLGGAIGAAQSRGRTDFAVSGSEFSTVHKLSDEFCTRVRVPLPEGRARLPDGPQQNHARRALQGSPVLARGGVAINGTLAGLRSRGRAPCACMGCSRALRSATRRSRSRIAWKAHSAVDHLGRTCRRRARPPAEHRVPEAASFP